jgi:uncharacterized protein (DUF1684 family)
MYIVDMKTLTIFAAAALVALTSCTKPSSRPATAADSLRAVNETLDYRRMAEEYFRSDPQSPFNTTPPVPFEGLRWFPPDPGMYFTSKLERFENPETVTVYGTKNEPRKQVRYGYFTIEVGGAEHRLNVYKFPPDMASQYPELEGVLSVWFTDETTGKETYQVGRYLEIEREATDPDHLYVVNLNNAHNPYCAYNHAYSCPIPTREDRIPVAIRAGEMNYHVE